MRIRPPVLLGIGARALLLAALWTGASALQAQPAATPASPPLVSPGVPASAPASAASITVPSEQAIAAELESARAAQARLEALALSATPPPLVEEQRNLQARLILLLAAEQRRQSKPAEAPSGTSTQSQPMALQADPPFAITEVDALRDQRDGLQTQRGAVAFAQRALEVQITNLVAAQRKAEELLRLSQDRLARAQEGDDLERLRAQTEVARLEARVASLEVARADQERGAAQARVASLGGQIEKLGLEIDRVRPHQVASDETLAEVATAASAARKRLAAQRRTLELRLAALERSRDLQDGSGVATNREIEAIRGRISTVAELDQIEIGKEDVWRQRRLALQSGSDPERRTTAKTLLRRSLDQLAQRIRSTEEHLDYARATARLQGLRVEGLAEGTALVAAERRALDAWTQQVTALEAVKEALQRMQSLLQRSLDDLGQGPAPQTANEWMSQAGAALRDLAHKVWGYELFSVSETAQAEGRAITLEYGVTVGKSVGVLVLLVLGYFIARLLSQAVIRLLVRWMQLSPALGRVLHRWLMSILLLVVLIAVLKLTRIPLTAFAFMGGALAIGIGFGTQNMIKNLISGVIILFERKIRVGDVITIDGVSGTVSAVDLRATTVRGFDGIESIVPNSKLLENQVSNWSYQSPTVRRSFTIGLGYGQDLDLALSLVERCATQHGSVLEEPGPEVLVDDFGNDNVVLRLQYWMRLGGPRGGPGIDSDLRRAVSAVFAEHGLAMAYPQRDVHLNLRTPVEVNLRHGPT